MPWRKSKTCSDCISMCVRAWLCACADKYWNNLLRNVTHSIWVMSNNTSEGESVYCISCRTACNFIYMILLLVSRTCEDQESVWEGQESGPQHVHWHTDNRYAYAGVSTVRAEGERSSKNYRKLVNVVRLAALSHLSTRSVVRAARSSWRGSSVTLKPWACKSHFTPTCIFRFTVTLQRPAYKGNHKS